MDNFNPGSGPVIPSPSAVEPASYVLLPASADFTGLDDFPGLSDNSYSAPSNEFSSGDAVTGSTNVRSDDYGSPSTTGSDYSAPSVSAGEVYGSPSITDNGGDNVGFADFLDLTSSLDADYSDVPVYNPLDTNSLESGLGQPQFLDDFVEDAPLSSYVEVSSLDDSGSLETFQTVPDTGYSAPDTVLDEVYDDGDEVPSYLIPRDIHQASISVQFASPRDTRGIDLETEAARAARAAFGQSLVIDLTSEDLDQELDYPSPVYGQRLGRSSSSLLSRLRAARRRHHR